MHQPTELLCDVDEYIQRWDQLPEELSPILYEMAYNIVNMCHQYADDGSDPLEYAEVANSEMDFIDWFVEEIENDDFQNGRL